MKFLNNMISKLSKTLSIVLIRLLDQYLLNPEICWHFKIFICGSKFSKIEIGRYRLEILFLSLILGSLMLEHYYIKKRQCGHVLVALHNYFVWNLIFWKTHTWLQSKSLNAFHFGKVLTKPPVTVDLGAPSLLVNHLMDFMFEK